MPHKRSARESYQSSTELAFALNQFELHELYNGVDTAKKKIPSARLRQDDLIGTVIECAMPALLEERLQMKRGASVDDMFALGVFKAHVPKMPGRKSSDIRVLVKSVLKKLSHTNSESKHVWTPEDAKEFAGKLQQEGVFQTRDDFAGEEEITHFYNEVKTYQKIKKQEEDYRKGEAKEPQYIPKMPKHPYVIAYRKNDMRKKLLDLFENGEKELAACKAKAKNRAIDWEISDINRLTVMPRTARIAESYNGYLKQEVEGRTGQRMFYDKPFHVNARGLLEAKMNIVLTRGFGQSSGNQIHGSVAEVKIMPPFMRDAYLDSHPVYSVMREFFGRSNKLDTANMRGEVLERFAADYHEQMIAFSAQSHGNKYRAFTEAEMANKFFVSDDHKKARLRELEVLIQSIHVHPVKAAPEWHKLYIEQCLKGNLEKKTAIDEDLLSSIDPEQFLKTYEKLHPPKNIASKKSVKRA